jgi:uncharacterized protein Yka (UPF0111/DUF47 family)
MRLAFVPKTTEFYDFFTRAGENLLATARLAEQRFREFPETSVDHEQVKDLENQGDELTREIIAVAIAGLAFLGRRLEARRWRAASAPAPS